MKIKLISFILILATLLTLTACGGEKSKNDNGGDANDTQSSNSQSDLGGLPIVDEIDPDFQKFVGEWRTLDNEDASTVVINPNKTMTVKGQTIRIVEKSNHSFCLETAIKIKDSFGEYRDAENFSFSVNDLGLYVFNFSVPRDASISYSHKYFRVEDYEIIEFNTENYEDYVRLNFYSECQRANFSDDYEADSGVDLKLKCDYIYDLEITFNCQTIYRPVSFTNGKKPVKGDITKSDSGTETVKAERPFSSDSSYAHRRSISFSRTTIKTWGQTCTEDNVCFVEVEDVVSVSGKAFVPTKRPADDPNHVHFYDSETCRDESGNKWKECECGEKTFVVDSESWMFE